MQFPRGPVTHALIIINLAIAAILLVPSLWQYAVVAGGLFPARLSGDSSAFAGITFLVPALLTPLTAAFLHGGIAHVIMNMLMLLLIGKMVERVLGGGLFLALYMVSAYAAAATEWLAAYLQLPMSLDMMAPAIGASGAISGIIGAYVLLFPNKQPKPWGPIPAGIARPLHLTLAWIGLNLAMGFVGPGLGVGIAIWSHIGGFVMGLALARPLLLWRYRNA
ncbi:membrane associated rhomboid family serine protease [Sphingorhabdus rigui]|uniref:Membrane associated rhomboid family serine protease n=1 Tax=Sphingorhabdus rigui TaxID=1282858 RepID=A0A840AZ26_9SPHN|nr:rhomboid family intramembrane serine protease [Sphingorhabdus rigui]MBB3942901.1 membrane associated rhomboid family serine protease [Sphingorhabdus rigui]